MYKFDYFKDNITNVYQIRIDSEVYTVDVDDTNQEMVLCDILDCLKEKSSDIQKLIEILSAKYSRKLLIETIDALLNFIPEFKIEKQTTGQGTKNKNITIFSDGIIGDKLCQNSILSYCNISHYKFEDIISVSLDDIIEYSDFAFVDGSVWSPFHIRQINKAMLKRNKPWLLIDGRLSSNPTIGPLFWGSETGCYDCLIDRYKNNLDESGIFSSYLNFLCSNRICSNVETDVLKKEYLSNFLVDFAVLEYVNFMDGWKKPETYRTVIEFDYSNYDIIKHKLLKVPYCQTCKPELKYNSAPWIDSVCL